jgi:hypothetical protein
MYREEASPYPGMQPLIRDLIEAPGIRVGLVTRHISHDPAITLARLFARHDLDIDRLDFLHCLPLREGRRLATRRRASSSTSIRRAPARWATSTATTKSRCRPASIPSSCPTVSRAARG